MRATLGRDLADFSLACGPTVSQAWCLPRSSSDSTAMPPVLVKTTLPDPASNKSRSFLSSVQPVADKPWLSASPFPTEMKACVTMSLSPSGRLLAVFRTADDDPTATLIEVFARRPVPVSRCNAVMYICAGVGQWHDRVLSSHGRYARPRIIKPARRVRRVCAQLLLHSCHAVPSGSTSFCSSASQADTHKHTRTYTHPD